ncbi:hypothetical protein BURMUCF2_B0506 [Burkholderia multivorans CF2]|nr:hypothetical protein BURMUCF2_B0506 [Burkholderia multivorans CF2]
MHGRRERLIPVTGARASAARLFQLYRIPCSTRRQRNA